MRAMFITQRTECSRHTFFDRLSKPEATEPRLASRTTISTAAASLHLANLTLPLDIVRVNVPPVANGLGRNILALPSMFARGNMSQNLRTTAKTHGGLGLFNASDRYKECSESEVHFPVKLHLEISPSTTKTIKI